MSQITSINEPWGNGHTHAEVEEFLKSEIERLSGTSTRARSSVAVEGGTNRSFINGDTNITFSYTASYSVGETVMSSIKHTIAWREAETQNPWNVIESGTISTGVRQTSPNLAAIFNTISAEKIAVRLYVYDTQESVDGEGQTVEVPIAESTVNFTFNRQTAVIRSNVPLGQVISTGDTLSYYVGIAAGHTATLVATYYKRDGITEHITLRKAVAASGNTTIGVPSFDSTEAGPHRVVAYLVLDDDEETESDSVTSTVLSTSGASDGSIYILADEISGTSVNNYVDVNFMVYVHRATPIENEVVPVLLQELNGSTWETKAIRNITVGNVSTWKYFITSEETYLQLVVPSVSGGVIDETDVLADKSISFTSSASNIGWSAASGAMIFLTAQNKTNSDYDIGTWKYGTRTVAFEDVQWNANGSGWLDTFLDNEGRIADPEMSSGRYSTSLHLVGTSRAYVRNFYPLYDTSEITATQGGGILAKGRTLKMSFMVTNVSNPDEKVIDCYDEISGTGFYVTGNAIYINIGKELISFPEEDQHKAGHNARRFSSDTRIDLTIVVQPYYQNGVETKHEVRYYINGEIAGFDVLTDTELSQSTPTLLRFGGSGAVLDLFDFRYYEKALSAFEVLQTRTMDLDSSEEMNATFSKNNFYEVDSNGNPVITLAQAIAYGKWLAEQGKTNFAVWVTTNLCNGSAYLNNTKTHSTSPESFYVFRFKTDEMGVGIIDPDMTFFVEALGLDAANQESYLRMRRQGTSTASSTKGNIRVDVRNSCRYHKFNPTTQKFYAYTGADDEHVYTVGKKAKIWQIPDASAIPCYLLTCKKNPNESTQARNLPTAKWYEDCCRHLATVEVNGEYIYEDCLSKPQQRELESIIENRSDLTSRTQQVAAIKTRQCVDGIPSLGFEIAYLNSEDAKIDPVASNPSFGGQFDMITDKTNMDVFGFGGYSTQDADGNLTWHKHSTDEDFSIEWRRNASTICNFLTQDLSALNGSSTFAGKDNIFMSDLEYRYPDVEPLISESSGVTKEVDGQTVSAHTAGMSLTGPMQGLFDFIRTCAVIRRIDAVTGEERWIIDGTQGRYYKNGIPLDATGVNTGKLPLCSADGTITSWVTDNAENRLSKFKNELKYHCIVNQFLFNAIAIDAALMIDQDTKNQFFTHFTGEDDTAGNQLIRLLGYDFDSSWDMDNDNYFRFLYTVRYEDGLYDGAATILGPEQGDNADGLNYDANASREPGRGPVLWQMIYKAFATEIATMASYLYSGFLNKDAILARMEDNQVNIYNSMMYNANSEYSYTSNAGDYQKTHGAAKEHTAWFVEGRMHYYSARQGVKNSGVSNTPLGDFAEGNAEFNTAAFTASDQLSYPLNYENHGSDSWAIEVTGYERTAASLGFGATQFFSIKDVDVDVEYVDNMPSTITRKVTTLTAPGISAAALTGDARFKIFGGKHLKTLTGLSKWYISGITKWGDLTNIEELEIGSTETLTKTTTVVDSETEEGTTTTVTERYCNPNLTSFPTTKPFGSCKKLNLAGCFKMAGRLDLTKFPVLEEFEGTHMEATTTISFPVSNSLKKAHLSSGLQNLTLDNKPNLSEITFEGINSITSVRVTNSSNYAAQQAITLFLSE